MVKIISDSTSDLSQDLLDRYNITLVPLIVRLGDQQYEDLSLIHISEPTRPY